MKSRLLLFVLLLVPMFVFGQTAPITVGCYTKTMSATGRNLIFATPSDLAGITFTGDYLTTGSPTGVSLSIETANFQAASGTPFTKISAQTNTTGAKFSEANDGARYWFANLATLTGGTSPTVVLRYCMREQTMVSNTTLVASSSITGTGASVLQNTPTLITPDIGVATGTGLILTGTSGNILTAGRVGATNPVFNVNANTGSVATGLNITGAAAAGGLAVAVTSSGAAENLTVDAKGTGTVTINGTATGAITLARATGVTGAITGTSTSASALTVGANGATNPVLKINAATGSVATGVEVTGAAAAGGVNLAAISSGAAENLTINAKGTGTIGIAPTSTGAVTITPATTITGALTPTGGVAAAGGYSTSCRTFSVGNLTPLASTDFNNSTPIITETYMSEVFVPANCTATGVALFNGSDVTGNVIVGIVNAGTAQTPLANSALAGTAGSGPDAYQLIPFTASIALKGPATYFILTQYSSGTARYNSPILGAFGTGKKTGETFGTLTTYTTPTTFTTNIGNVASLY